MGDFSLMDSEFNNIRGRFDTEMKKMEEEMNKFRGELISRESDSFRKTSARETNPEADLLPGVTGGMGGHSAWLQGLKSPLIAEDEGAGVKELKLRFDVSQYTPEEIMVKTVDNKLLVHAKHEESGGGKSVYREYNREFLLPQGTNPELIKSSLSKDGILTVEAPLPTPAITNVK
eukprot:TRINITY_DN1419_c0_g1_i4.p1 TRINITY_DN1419_c0_g1~~TRINITY_DN1419_c0_g1_i4.p1  ORF type:complete len:203 (-),score=69.29 TRINITY_DN1419_c0_g1_i4:65-589(-)